MYSTQKTCLVPKCLVIIYSEIKVPCGKSRVWAYHVDQATLCLIFWLVKVIFPVIWMGAGHHSIYIGDRDPDDMNQKLSDLYYLL